MFALIIFVSKPTYAMSPPPSSKSYYMNTVDTDTLYNMGYQKGQEDNQTPGTQNSIIILDFGSQTKSSDSGPSLFGGPDASIKEVENAVEAYSKGYWKGTGSDNKSTIHLVVGTNNSSQETYSNGKAWAEMVNDIASYNTDHSYSDQVILDGGNDMEPNFNSVSATKDWVDGYASAYRYFLYNYGSADGCPAEENPTGSGNGTCSNDWTQDDIYQISWGAAPTLAIPEIYNESGTTARQWQNISKYAAKHYKGMQLKGALTQDGACTQSGNSCIAGTDNKPDQGWQQLYDQLNKDPDTQQSELPYSTDITWRNDEPSAQSQDTAVKSASAGEPSYSEQSSDIPLPPVKQAIVNRHLKDMQQAINNHRLKSLVKSIPDIIQHDKKWTTKILSHIDDPLNYHQINFTNGWRGTGQNGQSKGKYSTVEAGALKNDPKQGVIVVHQLNDKRILMNEKVIKTPGKHGAVKVLDQQGNNLILKAKDGYKWIFDTVTGKFEAF
ncbi:hypothetical protein [Scopulibacillus cellulosilyticus]|uniref:Uncharacterized protein n=1 Tax=Scopulibacillus cellulosilyticus TaxID=2665665 RepID=A0ABW2Q2F1_9BACL